MYYKISLVLVFLLPVTVFSQVVITEIMYDLEGSDDGREWIEITNTGPDAIDVSSWKLYENETNHKLTLFQGDSNLSSKESAIITDSPDKFLIDWPNFKGTLFDSSFSLKNTGELITLRNPDLTDVYLVNFLSQWGAIGDGNSLQKADSSWLALLPTPGQYDFGESESESEEENPSPNISLVVESEDGGNVVSQKPPVKVVKKAATEIPDSTKDDSINNQATVALVNINESPESVSEDKVFGETNGSFFNKWFLAVFGVIVLSILSVLFVGRDNTVEGYTIIE